MKTGFDPLVLYTKKRKRIINDSVHRAVTVLESGILDLDPLITHEITLEELDRGIELLKSGEGMEIIIRVGA